MQMSGIRCYSEYSAARKLRILSRCEGGAAFAAC